MRLTPKARELLVSELVRRSQASPSFGRLTRDARADAIGVSVPTSDKILGGKPVDRTTLIHAFGRLEIEWSDSFCEPPKETTDVQETTQDLGEALPEPASSPAPRNWKRVWFSRLLVGMVAYTAWIGTKTLYIRHFGYSPEGDFNSALESATNAYHAGNYTVARSQIARAIRMARDFHSTDRLSFALRVAGDLAAEQGDFSEGKTLYQKAIDLREDVNEKEYEPSIYEAMGDLEIRAGDLRSAEEHLLTARSGYENMKDPNGVAMCERDLGSLCLLKHDLPSARRWLTEAGNKVRGLGAADLFADIRARTALVDRDCGDLRRARSALLSCLNHWKSRGHPRWIAETQYQLASVEAAAGNQKLAEELVKKSKAGFVAVGDRYGARECDNLVAQGTKR